MAHYVVQKVKYRVFGWDTALDFSVLYEHQIMDSHVTLHSGSHTGSLAW